MRSKKLILVLSGLVAVAAMNVAKAVPVSVIVTGAVSQNNITNAGSPYFGVPVGATASFSMLLDSSSTQFSNGTSTTQYNWNRANSVFNVQGVGNRSGSGNSSFVFDNGFLTYYSLQPSSFSISGGPQTSVTFSAEGTTTLPPNASPFNTASANILNSAGTYSPSVFNCATDQSFNCVPGGPSFYVSVLQASLPFGNDRMTIGIQSIQITPEPTSLAMLGLAAGATLIRRRRVC